MKVNKSSWHYRLLDRLGMVGYWQENLCNYFWKLVFATIVIPVATFFAVFMLSIPLWWWLTDRFMGPAIFIGALEIMALLGILLILIHDRHKVEIRRGERQPSIAYQWLKAKKQKVCPLIEFE